MACKAIDTFMHQYKRIIRFVYVRAIHANKCIRFSLWGFVHKHQKDEYKRKFHSFIRVYPPIRGRRKMGGYEYIGKEH